MESSHSTHSYLIGWILGSVVGIGCGLGHAEQWAHPGPFFAVLVSSMFSIVMLYVLHIESNESKPEDI